MRYPLILIAVKFIILFLFHSAYSQKVDGKVIDVNSGEPIPYVNIGVVDKGFGTISDSSGQYALTFSKSQLTDSIVFQHVSYKTKRVLVEDLIKNTDIHLEEKVTSLNELVISSKAPKKKKIGIRTHNPLLWGGFGIGDEDIYEIAQEIKTNKRLRVLDFNIYLRIFREILPFKYRIKVYQSEDGVPGKLIIDDNIIIEGIVDGWNSVDLTPFNIITEGDFFVSIEFLPNPMTQKYNISAGAVLIGGNRFSRNSSLGKWNKAQGGYKLYITGEY